MKKTKKVSTLIFIALFAIGIAGCEKYDEGGRLAAANKKIVNLWKIDYAVDLEDGTNITADYTGEFWEFTKSNDYKENDVLKGTYTFSEDKLTLIILESSGGTDTYQVLKLTSDEMWLEEAGSEEIHLVPYN